MGAGKVLEDIGGIGGYGVTSSATVMKMYYELGQNISLSKKET